MRASQDEDRRGRGSSPQPFAVISKSRCQTAHLVPAAHFCVRGLQLCFTHPEQGVGGAPRNVRVLGGTPVRRIMTRYARRLARRLASHDAGRSPLGAPPWRFWASGPRFRLLRRPPPYNGGQLPSGSVQRAPRSQVVVPGGRGPGPPEANGYKPPPQDATPRSAPISHKLLKQITLLEDGRGRPHSRLHSRSGRRDASARAPITRKGRSPPLAPQARSPHALRPIGLLRRPVH